MRPVAVVGIGKTRFGAFPDRDLRSLAVEAGEKCLQNGHVSPSQVEAFYLGNFAGPSFVGQNHLAPYISNALGIHEVPATRIEAACASSGSAFFHAVSAVAAGLYDVVMVVGVEKMTSQPTPRVTEILASAGDCGGEIRAGSTFPSLFAMIARRHMRDFGTRREHLAAVAVKNHANGSLNPDAHLRKVITLKQAMAGKPVADPLNLYDCSLISDGAAAAIVTVADRAGQFSELHDCFTIAEIIALEDLGFVPRGQGGPCSAAGYTALKGAKPMNTSGGLKAKGHPVGATGVAQICDIVQQIRGEGGERQVTNHSLGLAENLGGSGASCVVTILGEL